MSVLSLPRVVLYRINYSTKTAVELDPNDKVYCSGKYKNMAQWKYDLTALQAERAGRDIIISRVTASWYTSAKYTYDIRIQTGRIYEKKSGWYFGDATGTSKDSMQQISTTRYAGYDTVTIIQNILNTGASEIYMSCENESSPSGYGTCQYGELIIEYEYATPLKVINYLTCDSNQAVQGDTINYRASIRNVNKENTINSIQLELVRVENGVDISVGEAVTISRTLQPGELAEINREITIPSWANSARSTYLYLKATIAGADPEKELLCNVLDKKYYPTIENFQVYRSRKSLIDGSWIKSENGIHTLTDLKIYIGEGATGFTLYAYYTENGEPDITSEENRINLNSKIDRALIGFENETNVIDRTAGWGLNSNWHFALVLTDGYETARVDAELPKAFANMHLAGLSTGGVRFGGYCSRSTQDNPAFECDYPIYADGGIPSLDYSTTETELPYKWIDGKQIYRRVVQVGPIAASKYMTYDFMPTSEIGDIISIRGAARANDGSEWLPIPVASHWAEGVNLYAINVNVNCSADTATITVAMGSSRSITRGFVVIDYTKGE